MNLEKLVKMSVSFLFLVLFTTTYSQTKKEIRKERREEMRQKKEAAKQAREAILKTYVNPKGKWYFGVEMGMNQIPSYYEDTRKTKSTFQGGILAEYYFARHWSLFTKIKYFETGVSFNQRGTAGFFGVEGYSGTFRGAVISVPLNIKWEFRVFKNLGGNLKLGFAINNEIKSEYTNYSSNLNPNAYQSNYIGITAGWGLNYFLNNRAAIYFDIELYGGTKKGKTASFIRSGDVYNSNLLMSIGYKYNFIK